MGRQSLKIHYKLALGFGIVLTVTALFGAFLLTRLLAINKSSQSLYHKEIPALSKTYELLNHWQQAIFNLRSFSSVKEKHYYIQAQQHIDKAKIIIDSVKMDITETEAVEWKRVSDELLQFKTKAKKSYDAALAVERAYATLDTAQQTLNKLMQRLNHKSEKLTKSTITQASSTEEITASVEEIQSLTQNSHNESQKAAAKLKCIQSDVDRYIAQTKGTIEHMQLMIRRSKIISEMAAQTYILSLNASIEASRNKGENSKGFAAIARSMRELSERVKAATIELNELSAHGLTTSDEALKNLDNIKQIITNNSRIFQDMARMSNQQNLEIAQISVSIQHLNTETQKTTRLAEDLHNESAQLQLLGKELSKILSFYKSDNHHLSQTKVDKWKWRKIRFNKAQMDTPQKREPISV